MTTLLAGFGRSDITPALGCRLVGYGGRNAGAVAVHDPLHARALVLEDENGCWAIIACELCYLGAESVAAVRDCIQARTGIPAHHVFIATTHTHAGPHDRDAHNWQRPLAHLIADAAETAYEARQPARLGSGSGFLYGYSINRRWLDRPVDPGIAVLRVDDVEGNPLGLFTNFGCHSVVLGSDNLEISGDWPGYAASKLESLLGPGTTCLLTQGGAGDINPLVLGVRARLRDNRPVTALGNVSTYYGRTGDANAWNIGDRRGGTFDEVAELGDAFAEEVCYVASRIASGAPARPFWSEQVTIDAAAAPGEHKHKPPMPLLTEAPSYANLDYIPAELMMLGLDEILLVGQPGEVFAETAVQLKVHLRALGYATPALVSYANGFLLYLPEPDAFDEGGYEPDWAVALGISRHFQLRARAAIESILSSHAHL